MNSTMQKHSICLGLCTDKYLAGCTPLLGDPWEIHHGSEIHMSLLKAICAQEPILFCLLKSFIPMSSPLPTPA
jgi:hypothetical protein